MQKEFTKADLKSGMVVEYRNGKRRLVVNDMLIGEKGYLSLNSLDEDLKNIMFLSNDIMKIYRIKEERAFEDILKNNNLELIWERTETKRMTAEEMRKKLEELTGEKIEIEPSRNEMVGACDEYCDNLQFCKGCAIGEMCHDNGSNFGSYCDEELKQCYKKVIANGR